MTTTAVMRKQLFINGEWRDAAGGKTLEVVNPATEEVIAEVASAEQSDVDAAVAGRARGVRRPVGEALGARAWEARVEDRRKADREGRRPRPPRNATQRQADFRVAPHRGAGGRRVLPVLRGLGR